MTGYILFAMFIVLSIVGISSVPKVSHLLIGMGMRRNAKKLGKDSNASR